MGSPRRPRRRLLAARTDMALRVVKEALAMCGRITVGREFKKEIGCENYGQESEIAPVGYCRGYFLKAVEALQV